MSESDYISQGIDYLGIINAKLRDLRGLATLANELIQNADDTRGTTSIEFDVTDDRLIVSNDSKFSDCGAVNKRDCKDASDDQRKKCDFHAFRNVASGHKRELEGTTGAFGIGFISVYQITDQPILISGDWHWTLHPGNQEDKRIASRRLETPLDGTRFEFPWAKINSDLRARLGVETVGSDIIEQMLKELPVALRKAAPFLKRLERLVLKKDGQEVLTVTCERDDESDEILIGCNGNEQYWRKFRGDFTGEGKLLRKRHRGIEEKRKTEVVVAVPVGGLDSDENADGRFYASLPTEQPIGIPILINADFFPSTDRKRILLDGDYQGEWNCAAIHAAAQTLADNLLNLRDYLTPADLWQLLVQMRELHRNAENEEIKATNTVMGSFWECAKPVIESESLVYSVEGSWLPTNEIRNLQKLEEEEAVIPFLTSIGCQIVHPDLRSSYGLLNECNVSLLGISDIIDAMYDKGLDSILAESDIPDWFKKPKNREALGQEIDRLLQRVKKDDRDSLMAEVLGCSLVMTNKHELAPPDSVRRSVNGTSKLFSQIDPDYRWSSDENCPEILALVPLFDINDAILVLEKVDSSYLVSLYKADRNFIKELICWVTSRTEWASEIQNVLGRIRNLSIWPTSGQLRPLTQLSVPGDFDDPLHLANLLEMDVIDGRSKQCLIESLGAEELTLTNYVTQHIPIIFQTETSLEPGLTRELVDLLSIHIGQLKDSSDCASALCGCELIGCSDGVFRKPSQVYFESDIVSNVLGEDASIAVLPDENYEAVWDLFDWLGVSSLPRAVDIIERIERLCEQLPTTRSRKSMENIIAGITSGWDEFEEDIEEFEVLQEIAWLPGTGCDHWLKPSEVYLNFRSYLFFTQATFLNINRRIENSATELLDFLDIQSEPSTKQVIDHLLEMASQKKAVNPVVYTFLSDHADETLIDSLAGTDCLLLEGGRYVSASHVFWGQHPFGQYRERLGEDWRKHSELLSRIGVNDEPDTEDAIAVLLEISTKFGEYNDELDEDNNNIVLSCWQILSYALNEDDEEECSERIKAISTEKVIPDRHSILCLPESIFFEDRPRLAKRFEEGLAKHIIKRPVDAGEAMALAGVRPLSDAVSTELVECSNQRPSSEWNNLIQSRLVSLYRVLSANSDLQLDDEVLLHIECIEVDDLKLAYTLDFFGRSFKGEPESVLAHWDADKKKLFIRNDGKPGGEVAREIAFAVCSDASASQLAPGFKEVLSADSAVEAEQNLDELGFPPGEQKVDRVDDPTDYGVGGDDTEEEWTRPTDTPGTDTGGGETSSGGSEGTPSTGESNGDVATPTPAGDTGSGSPYTPGTGGTSGMTTGGSRTPRKLSRGRSRSEKVSRKIKQRTRNKRISYVSPEKLDEAELENQEQAESQAKETGDKAERWVVQYEDKRGREARRMPPNNPGYDIESVDPKTGEVAYIEVKGTEELWDGYGVAISQTQYEFAKEHGDSFWLYVVEDVSSTSPRVYPIKNPVAKINKYVFDHGWQKVVEDESSKDKAEEKSLDELIDELKEGESKEVQTIIDYCFQNDLPVPEVGYELMNEAGEVTADMLELAWTEQKVGVYENEDFNVDAYQMEEWILFGMEITQAPDKLAEALS